jgi:hypothetical protein
MLKHCAANRKRRLLALPKVSPYIHDVKISGFTRVILWVLDPRKCEYLKDYSLDFEHTYMTTYLAS